MRWFRKSTSESLETTPSTNAPDVDALIARIKEILVSGDIDTASSALDEAMAIAPDHVRLLALRARVIERTDGWQAAADFHDRVLFTHPGPLPRAVYVHASLCNRHVMRLARADEILTQGLAQYPKVHRLLREAAEISMAQGDWPTAVTRWTAYARRLLRSREPSAVDRTFPIRGTAGDWFSSAWSDMADLLTDPNRIATPIQPEFLSMLARTLIEAGLASDAVRLLERAVQDFGDDLQLQFLLTVAQRSLGVAPTHLPSEVTDAAASFSVLPTLEHDPSTGLGPIRVLRVPTGSSLELALRSKTYIDRADLTRRVREISTRDAWPETTSETNLLMQRAHETAKEFAAAFEEPPHLPQETLADSMYDAIQKELAVHLPMKRVARAIATEAGTEPVVIEIPALEFPYLGGYTAGDFDLVYLYFELVAAGCDTYFGQLIPPAEAAPDEPDFEFSFPPGWITSVPRTPLRDIERHGEVALVPAGMRAVAWVSEQLPDASVFQSGRVIKAFAYDRSIRQGQPVLADVRLYPVEDPLPSFTFPLDVVATLPCHDLTTPSRTLVHGQVLVSEAVGGTWLEWLGRAAMPLLRHLAHRAHEEVEVHGLKEAHVADHFYPEGIIVGDAVRRAGGSVVLHPHSSNPVHVSMRRSDSFDEVHAVTRSGVETWQRAFPDKQVHHTTKGMLQSVPAPTYEVGAPVSLVLFGGRPMLGHLPILDLDAHDALYRSFFERVEALQRDHPVKVYFKPRGLTGEHEDWLHRVVGRVASWEPVYEHPLRLALPNMLYGSVSMGTSALIEGLSRGIPGLIVREFPVRDYTTLDAETFPILTAAAAADLVATCTTETGYRSLIQSEFDQYRDELGLKS